MKSADLGVILGIWVHPDDEACPSGGLMAATSDAGRRYAPGSDRSALRLDPDLLDRKVVALRAQASQTAPLIQETGVEAFGKWIATEHFVVAP